MSKDSDMEKRLKKFLEDMQLVTETAKVLATKLEKLQSSLNELLPYMSTSRPIQRTEPSIDRAPAASVETTVPTPQRPTRPVPRPTRTEAPSPAPPSEPTRTIAKPSTSSAEADTISSILRSLREDIEKTATGKEISRILLDTQDRLLEIKGFHPALREMRTLASEFKNREQLTKDDKTVLIEKVYDWETRMLT